MGGGWNEAVLPGRACGRCAGLRYRGFDSLDYVRANRVGIQNYRTVPLTSSGPMERAIDVLASRRLKPRGMSSPRMLR